MLDWLRLILKGITIGVKIFLIYIYWVRKRRKKENGNFIGKSKEKIIGNFICPSDYFIIEMVKMKI